MTTVNIFQQMKLQKQKIVMLTCYDYASAQILNHSEVDCILVGDSGGMVQLGYKDTTFVTMNDMLMFVHAVAKGAPQKFIIADMPFLSYRESIAKTMENVRLLIQAGAQAIKLEGAIGNLATIRHIVESGIPVMGHIGLTPQQVHGLGGYKVQGKTQQDELRLLQEAKELELAGCFSIVLECVPAQLAGNVSTKLNIPTIGIGAGKDTDGQVLVIHDCLGIHNNKKLKFVKKYINTHDLYLSAINTFSCEVKTQIFPSQEHSFMETLDAVDN